MFFDFSQPLREQADLTEEELSWAVFFLYALNSVFCASGGDDSVTIP